MDRKEISISIAIIASTLAIVLTQNKFVVAIITIFILALMVAEIISASKELKAVMQEDKIDTKVEIQKRILK
jgi:hypothetical protein